MQRNDPLMDGEIYHIYNRGAHKDNIFLGESDYFRFKLLLFLANNTSGIHMANLLSKYKGRSFMLIFEEENPDQALVDVLSYALMPNHFHLIVRQTAENGITQFMKKVSTAYSMYFNALHEHSGTVFQGRFKSKHVDTSEYLRWLFAYVALNPLDVGFPGWKEKGVQSREAYDFLISYNHASFPDMCQATTERPERIILAQSDPGEYSEDIPDFSDIRTLFEIERTEI